jgi:hypothetical protein
LTAAAASTSHGGGAETAAPTFVAGTTDEEFIMGQYQALYPGVVWNGAELAPGALVDVTDPASPDGEQLAFWGSEQGMMVPASRPPTAKVG